MRFGPIRIYFSYLRIFAGVRQATVLRETELPGVHSGCTQAVCLSICVPVCLCTCLFVCVLACLPISVPVYLSVCLYLFLPVYLSVCLSVYLSVHLSICFLLLVFEIFFVLLYQDPQYVSVGSNGEASTQELKQVGIVNFWRCFVTFCVSGIVWTFSLKLTYIFFILKSYVVCELQYKKSLVYSFIKKNIWKIRFWFSCLVVNR